MQLTAVYFGKMLDFRVHYNRRRKLLLMQRDRSSNAVSMNYRGQGTQVQATAEKDIFNVSVNFYVLPFDFSLILPFSHSLMF